MHASHIFEHQNRIWRPLKNWTTPNSLIVPTATFLSTFILSFIAGSFIIQPQATKAVTGLGLVGSPTVSLSAGGSKVSMDITPTQSGKLVSASQNLSVATNVPTGYNLSLSMPNMPSLATTPGTITNPSTLTNNTWGYALTRTNAVGVVNDFDSSYAVPIPSSSSKWANPSANTVIKNTSTAAANDTTDIYFGAKVDTTLPSRTYENTVRYTATTNLPDISSPAIISVTPNSGTTAGSTAIQIVGTGFTVNDQSVTTAVIIDNQACQNITISSNTPSTGQDTIQCTTPAKATAGAVSASVSTWKSTATKTSAYTYIAPTATITTPAQNQIIAANTTSTTLTVTTDIPATCYYGTATNPTTAMSATGNRTTHTQSLTGLTNTSTNTRYVRCQAATGHTYSTNQSVTFYIKAATPATPTTSPASGATVNNGTTTITVTSTGATCTWGTASGSYPNASGATRTTTTGTNTLYYRCLAGSGNTQSDVITGSWIYTGQAPLAQIGDDIQTVTTATCPTTRTRVRDARDNATYWIQKMADGRCWMLTNLAYGGGGTNTYGDVKDINNGGYSSAAYAVPYYYIPGGSNRTTGTTDPSTSTDGRGQYGYLYNWCAAMGVQIGTAACADDTTPAPNTSISICPAGWKLPITREYQQLATAIGATTNGNDGGAAGSTALRSIWLAMYGGNWYYGTFYDQNVGGSFWSATQHSDTYSYSLSVYNSYVSSLDGSNYKTYGYAVRCISS